MTASAAVKHRMEEMGYQEQDYNLDSLYAAFLKLADKKGQVFDYDLEALALPWLSLTSSMKSRSIPVWTTSACSPAAALWPPRR